jgi:L-fuculose-phosphate aldolase
VSSGLQNVRADVAQAARQLAREGLVLGTAGNVSARLDELVAGTPTGAELATLTEPDVTVVDLDGVRVGDGFAPTSELALHLGVYARYDAGAVVHAHSPIATALACVDGLQEVPPVHYAMLDLGGAVRVAPYVTYGTTELADAVVTALEGRTAALMANHGVVVYGRDVAEAVARVALLEWACELYWRAAAIGTPRALSEDQLEAVRAKIDATGYGSVSR